MPNPADPGPNIPPANQMPNTPRKPDNYLHIDNLFGFGSDGSIHGLWSNLNPKPPELPPPPDLGKVPHDPQFPPGPGSLCPGPDSLLPPSPFCPKQPGQGGMQPPAPSNSSFDPNTSLDQTASDLLETEEPIMSGTMAYAADLPPVNSLLGSADDLAA